MNFGREEKIGAKRKVTTNIQYFRQLPRAHVYDKHLNSQHLFQWENYSEFSKYQKTIFFHKNSSVVWQNNIKSHFGGSQAYLHHFFRKGMVDIIMVKIIFHPDDLNDYITKEQSL